MIVREQFVENVLALLICPDLALAQSIPYRNSGDAAQQLII